tara:strand:+ start:645 stop:944 length:300 start_codon:yes stop_codon:yes gene_type:complete
MQFMITAYDYSDSDALNRRLAAREKHLDKVKKAIASGNFLSGGAILNEQGLMIGSTLHLEFPSREALDLDLQQDPYITAKVWEKIDIQEIRLVSLEEFR